MFDKLDDLLIRFEELMSELQEPDVANDQNRFRKLMKEQSDLAPIVEAYNEYKSAKQAITDSEEMLEMESDEEMRELAKEELSSSKKRVEELEHELKILLLPKDPNDDKNIMVEIRAGAGGDESALFAAEVYRMYVHYAESRHWKTEMISFSENGIGGFKEVVFMVSGQGVYSRMKVVYIVCSVFRRQNPADVSTLLQSLWQSCRRRKKWMLSLMKKISVSTLCVRPEMVDSVSIQLTQRFV